VALGILRGIPPNKKSFNNYEKAGEWICSFDERRPEGTSIG